MRGCLVVTLACAVVAVPFAASASETETRSGSVASLVVDWACGGVLSPTTSTQQKRQHHRHHHRGNPSLVSHWLDSALGSSFSQEEEESSFFPEISSSSTRHHERGNSSHPPGGSSKGRGGGRAADNDDGHKPLLPLGARDYIGLLAAALAILLASGSGIGGGGLLVPVFLLVLGFGTRDSVALSNLTIVGSALEARGPATDRLGYHPGDGAEHVSFATLLVCFSEGETRREERKKQDKKLTLSLDPTTIH